MESVVKVSCSKAELSDFCRKKLLDIRFSRFDIRENGFDPRILTKEQMDEEYYDCWTYVLGVRHADFGPLLSFYNSLRELAEDIQTRGMAYVRNLFRKEVSVHD